MFFNPFVPLYNLWRRGQFWSAKDFYLIFLQYCALCGKMVTWLVPLCLVCGSSQLENKLSPVDKTLDKQPSRWKPEKACEDMYDRYCSALTSDKCYLNYNLRLCCAKCEAYKTNFSVGRHGISDSCLYGDKDASCSTVETNKCYTTSFRQTCCGTCARAYTAIPECLYGDKNVEKCAKIKPFYCYKSEVRSECCGSCARHHTGRQGCEYGDRVMLITRSRRKYSCAAYTAHFGYARCRLPWETAFQQGCCGSCHNSSVNSKMRRHPYYFSEHRN